jgi:hypothetical protein
MWHKNGKWMEEEDECGKGKMIWERERGSLKTMSWT